MNENKNTILVVDDNPDILYYVAALLGAQGYSVLTSENAMGAIAHVQQNEINVVLTDIMMPEVSGIELLEMIHGVNPEMPVILMTAHAELDVAVDAVKKGAFDFIIKPFEREYLLHAMEKAFENNRLVSIERTYKRMLEDRLYLLKMSVESLDVGLTITDTKGLIIYTNPAEAKMHGYTVEELMRRDVRIFSPPELKNPTSFERSDPEKTHKRESVNIRRDGTTFPVRLLSISVKDSGGIPSGIITICEDITEYKQAEKDIKAAHKMAYDILDNSPYGTYVVNQKGTIDYVNPAMLRISGDSYEDFMVLSIYDIPPYRKLGITEKIESTLQGKPFFLGPIKYTSAYGKKTTIRNFIGIPLGEDTQRKALIFVEDITELKQAEEEYVRLAAAVESAAEAIVITDTTGRIQYANPAFEQITGYIKEEVTGKTTDILKSDRHDEEFYKTIRETLGSGRIWKGHFVSKKKDGSLFEEDAVISPVKSQTGEILNYVEVRRDVTEKMRLESIAEAVNTLNNIGYIFSGIRHEIGNPINSAKITLSVLKNNLEKYSKDTIREYIDRSMTEIARVEYLLKSLKNFNMHESQNLQDVPVTSFFNKLLPLIEKDYERDGIQVKTIIHPEAEVIYADPRALHQVILNILTNSSDALEGRDDPKIVISVFRTSGYITIRIVDNGCGMPEDFQHNLFKPFNTSKPSGTGLGLVIAKKMVTQMNGTIEITSRKGAGTIVDISIPEARIEHP